MGQGDIHAVWKKGISLNRWRYACEFLLIALIS
jgi:hypothetical protein